MIDVMLYADVSIAELQTQSFLIGLVVGAIAGVALFIGAAVLFGKDDADSEDSVPEHLCPYCGAVLRAITVRCVDSDEPIPPEAQWICPAVQCEAYWFADRPAAKSTPIEEV